MKCTRLVFFFLLLLVQYKGHSQDFSNKGKDFWLGYGYHVNMNVNAATGGTQDMKLYFTSDKNANVKVEIPGVGYSQTFTVVANQVTTTTPIPKTGPQDARILGVGLYNRGIHVTSDVPVVAYAHLYDMSVSGASLLFPTNTLGKDYYSINYTQSSNSQNGNSFFFVVATEDNTTVEITPSATNVNGLPVGQVTKVTLNQGEVYNVMGRLTGLQGSDLTGSRIRSVSANGTGGCKKIAVFSGAGKMSIGGAGNAGGSADNIFAQAFPAVAWGKKYLTVPTGSQPNNFYRICVTDPNTVVKLNGVILPKSMLVGNFYYQFKNANVSGTNPPVPNLIESDLPVLVAQYCTTQGFEGNPNTSPFGDPEMIYLSPVEQTINNITLYSTSQFNILQSYINVVLKNGGVTSFTVDGVSKSTSFLKHPQDTGYSYAILPVSGGSHTLYSDTGFNAIAYGFGSAESYGYNAGTNLRDFTPVATFQNPYNRIDSAVTCVNTPLQFSVPLAFVPATIQWDFSAAPGITPSATIGPLTAFTPDSTKTTNGQTLSFYSTGKTYTFSKSNTAALRDTIKLYTTTSTPDGCGSNAQVYTIPVTVNDFPAPQFTVSSSGCVGDSVKFAEQGSGAMIRWLWNFGDGSVAEHNTRDTVARKYISGGTYTAKLKLISAIGCISEEAARSVVISSKPVANFSFPAVLCPGSDVVFTDASTSSSGAIAKWTWNFDNGSAALVNTTNASTKTQFTTHGSKQVTLQVETATGCKSDVFGPAVKINPLPEPGFIVPEICLSDANAQFTDTSKIAEGSLTKYVWDFNAGSPGVTPAPTIVSMVSVKSPQVKYYKSDNYKVSLTVTSALGCVASRTADFTVNGSTPKAAFEILNKTPYCGTKPIQLKNNSTVDFGNLTKLEIYWDFANQPTVKELDETPTPGKVYPHIYSDITNASKTYTVKLVAYSGGGACVNATTQTITVFPQPKAAFTVSDTSLCFGDTLVFTDKSQGVSSPPATWVWDLGRGERATVQNPQKQYNDSGVIGVSMYFFNGEGCVSDTVFKTLTIYPNPRVLLLHNTKVLAGGVLKITPLLLYGNELQYKWTPPTYLSSDTSIAPTAIPEDDITYRLTLTGRGGCTASDTIFVKVLKGPEVPNAFSPNGDGINDTWKIKYLESYPGATVDVYNRYGQVVYRSVGYDREWDGTYFGKAMPVGVYYYIINPKNGRKIITGSITIIK